MTADYDSIADALRDDPLYVDQTGAAEIGFDRSAQAEVSRALNESPNDVYIAVLQNADADPNAATQLINGVGDGTFAVIFGDSSDGSFGSTELPGGKGETQLLLEEAIDSGDGTVGSAFIGFVDRVDSAIDGDSAGSSDGAGGGGSGGWLPLGILAAAGGGGFLLYRRNKRAKELAQLNEARTALDEDITAYGEHLSALDLDLQPTSAVPVEARDEYARALDLYEGAKETSNRAERPMDLRPVTPETRRGSLALGLRRCPSQPGARS